MAETIILVHGLWMSGIEMAMLKRRLEGFGYACVAYSYRSVTGSLQDHVDGLRALAQSQQSQRLHFVCHSLGGVIAYKMLESTIELIAGRAVFMGTPLQGSTAANVLAGSLLGRMALGQAALDELVVARPRHWDGRRDIGTIAGSEHLGLGRMVSAELGDGSDGTVRIEETLLEGARDHIVLPVTHTGMLLSPTVASQAAHFLRTGHFDHSAS